MSTSKITQLGKLVQQRRESLGLTLRDVAKLAKVDPAWVMHIEHGNRKTPDHKLLFRLARVLDLPVEDLYALAGYTMPDTLPELPIYLRTKYDLPDAAVAELDDYFKTLKERYGEKGGSRDKRRR